MKPSEAIERLIESGLNESEIGAAVGASQSTINRIRWGQSPRYELGQALIDKALKVVRKKKAA